MNFKRVFQQLTGLTPPEPPPAPTFTRAHIRLREEPLHVIVNCQFDGKVNPETGHVLYAADGQPYWPRRPYDSPFVTGLLTLKDDQDVWRYMHTEGTRFYPRNSLNNIAMFRSNCGQHVIKCIDHQNDWGWASQSMSALTHPENQYFTRIDAVVFSRTLQYFIMEPLQHPSSVQLADTMDDALRFIPTDNPLYTDPAFITWHREVARHGSFYPDGFDQRDNLMTRTEHGKEHPVYIDPLYRSQITFDEACDYFR